MKEKTEEKQDKVVVRYNGGAGYDINYPTRGKVSIKPGETAVFNPHDPYELDALLQIIKVINGGRINYRTKMTKPDNEGGRDMEKIYRFKIESGMELLPKILQEHKFSASNLMTDEETAAIKGICPKFFDRPDLKRRIAV
jgi:hypothetical protein